MPIYEYECKTCGIFEKMQKFSEAPLTVCPTCGGVIRPDVVMYGEMLPERALEAAIRAVAAADTFIVAGTSLRVYPAASLVDYFFGRELVMINLSPTPYDAYATLLSRGPVERVLRDAAEAAL